MDHRKSSRGKIFKKQQKEESTLTLHIFLNEYAGSIEPQKYIGHGVALISPRT